MEKQNLINDLLTVIINTSVKVTFSDSDQIRFMGSKVNARKTLCAEWQEFVKSDLPLLKKVVFALTRIKEAQYFKNKNHLGRIQGM